MRAMIARLTLIAAATGALVACGPETEEYVPPPAPTRPASTADDGPEETVEDRVAAMIDTDERTNFGVETRDPFQQPRPQRGDAIGDEGGGPERECDVNAEPLGMTALEDLEVMGLITGTALPRAMFLAGGDAQAIIVTEGALAGPDCTNRLIDIRDNQVVFEQQTMEESGRVETVLEMNEARIAPRFIQIDSE